MICRRSGPFRSSAERPSEKQGTEDGARSELTAFCRIPAIRRHWELFLAYSLKEGQQVIQERVLRRRRVGIVVRRCARDRRSSPCVSEDPTAWPVSEPRRSPCRPRVPP